MSNGVYVFSYTNLCMNELKNLGVKLCLRYVDDNFASLESREKALEILMFLNNQHPNIRFTIEHEKQNRLAFLDTSIIRSMRPLFIERRRSPVFFLIGRV